MLIAPQAQADTGPYLNLAGSTSMLDAPCPPASFSCPVMGPDGVPQLDYRWGVEDNPVTVSLWGLQHWSWWTVRHDQADLDAAIRAADWHLARQRGDGAWEYQFDFEALGVPMTAPWVSSMAQGRAISLLVRAYSATHDAKYLNAAVAALRPFQKTVAEGGVTTMWDGLPWYEEYPAPGAEHVLNGFEYALIGLHDLADRSPLARDLWQAGLKSLVAKIGVFDVPLVRSQRYAGAGAGRLPVSDNYKRAHALATRWLAQATGDATVAHWATVWERYLDPLSDPPFVIRTSRAASSRTP